MRWLNILLLMTIMLMACSEIIVKTQHIQFEIDEKANKNHPVAVDFVLIYEEELLKKIGVLSAHDWFEKRAQFKRDYPDNLSTWEWEFVPGHKLRKFKIPASRKRAKGALLFASYTTEGEHKIRLDEFQVITIRLLEEKIELLKVQ